jgi:choloylglycine hydrolase
MESFRTLLTGLVAVLALGVSHPALACTAFQLKSNDGAQIYVRSMEFGEALDSKALIVPRGTEYTGTAPGGRAGKKWAVQHGYVGMNVEQEPSTVADGMNEKGLVVGVLYLPGFSEYLPAESAPQDKTIGSWEVANYLLASCATVEEAASALRNDVYVAQQEFAGFEMVMPFHWWVGDASGKVIIAEYVDGKLAIHDAPLGVLTNSPPYEWQQVNVSNYVDLSPVNRAERKLGDFTSINYGQGSGAVGLPGDMTPPSRFVRVALYSHWATPADTASETVNVGFHVLNSFDIFNGAIQSKQADGTTETKTLSASGKPKVVNSDITEWAVAHDRTNLISYIRTYGGSLIQKIDHKTIDFGQPGLRTIELQNEFAPQDISSKSQPLAAAEAQ